jgi:hypothetical protein
MAAVLFNMLLEGLQRAMPSLARDLQIRRPVSAQSCRLKMISL